MTNTSKISVREAVKHYQVSRPTLMKHLKDGKITGDKQGVGTGQVAWKIDRAELARVYSPREDDTPPDMGKLATVDTPLPLEETPEFIALQRELEVAREQITDLKADKAYLQSRIPLPAPDGAGGYQGGLLSRIFGRRR